MANAPAGRSKPAGVDCAREVGVMSSVLKTFDVLDVYQRLWRPLSVTELCRETGFPKSSLHRILSTLVRAGVLQQNDEGLYCLTLMLWKIGVWALGEVDMLQIAREHLETLSQATDETVHLAVLEPDGESCTCPRWKARVRSVCKRKLGESRRLGAQQRAGLCSHTIRSFEIACSSVH